MTNKNNKIAVDLAKGTSEVVIRFKGVAERANHYQRLLKNVFDCGCPVNKAGVTCTPFCPYCGVAITKAVKGL